MNKIDQTLSDLGFSTKEKAVYSALIHSSKPLTASHISKLSGVSRQTTYDIIEALSEKGAVNASLSKGIKRFSLLPLESMIDAIEQKQQALEDRKQKIRTLEPLLSQIEQDQENLPEITFFQGKKGMKTMFNEISDMKDQSLCAFGSSNFAHYLGDSYFDSFTKRRLKNNLNARVLLSPDGDLATYPSGKEHKREARIAPFKKASVSINIVDDKLYFFSFQGSPFGVSIRNKNIADVMNSVFESVWDQAKK